MTERGGPGGHCSDLKFTRCVRPGISSLVKKNGQRQHLKNPRPISEIKFTKMKFSALSVAAVLAFFAQTMAEPLPQGTPPVVTCPAQTFHCRSFTEYFGSCFDFSLIFEGNGPCVS